MGPGLPSNRKDGKNSALHPLWALGVYKALQTPQRRQHLRDVVRLVTIPIDLAFDRGHKSTSRSNILGPFPLTTFRFRISAPVAESRRADRCTPFPLRPSCRRRRGRFNAAVGCLCSHPGGVSSAA